MTCDGAYGELLFYFCPGYKFVIQMIKIVYRKTVPDETKKYIYRQRIRVKRFLSKKRIKVYSHPRSGTHFLEAFLGRNFYPKDNLFLASTYGHWSNRQIYSKGNPYQKLFGSHCFPSEISEWEKKYKQPMIYIFRDPRAAAYSLWKTDNFINPIYRGISFSDFLRIKLDWRGTPRDRSEPKWTVAEHWFHHVHAWHQLDYKKLLIIRYEDLKDNPERIYNQILKKFFSYKNYFIEKEVIKKKEIDPISNPIGLLPNAAIKDAWKEAFTIDDEQFFLEQIPDHRYIRK